MSRSAVRSSVSRADGGHSPVLSAEPSSSLTVLLHRALQTPLAALRRKPLLVMKLSHACDLYLVTNTPPSLHLEGQRPVSCIMGVGKIPLLIPSLKDALEH